MWPEARSFRALSALVLTHGHPSHHRLRLRQGRRRQSVSAAADTRPLCHVPVSRPVSRPLRHASRPLPAHLRGTSALPVTGCGPSLWGTLGPPQQGSPKQPPRQRGLCLRGQHLSLGGSRNRRLCLDRCGSLFLFTGPTRWQGCGPSAMRQAEQSAKQRAPSQTPSIEGLGLNRERHPSTARRPFCPQATRVTGAGRGGRGGEGPVTRPRGMRCPPLEAAAKQRAPSQTPSIEGLGLNRERHPSTAHRPFCPQATRETGAGRGGRGGEGPVTRPRGIRCPPLEAAGCGGNVTRGLSAVGQQFSSVTLHMLQHRMHQAGA